MIEHLENTATKIGSAVAVGSGALNFLVEHAAAVSVVGIICGICLAVTGFVFQFRRDRREQQFHEKRMND